MTRSTVYGYDAKGKQKFAIPVEVAPVDGGVRDRFRWEPVRSRDRKRVLALLDKGGRLQIDLEEAHGAERDMAEQMLREAWSEGWNEFIADGGVGAVLAQAREEELARRDVLREDASLQDQRDRWTDQQPCPTCDCNDYADDAEGVARTGCTVPKDVELVRLAAAAEGRPDPFLNERCTDGDCRCWGGKDAQCEGCWIRSK